MIFHINFQFCTIVVCSKNNNFLLQYFRNFVCYRRRKFLIPPNYEIIMVPSNYSFFQYCDSNIRFFIAIKKWSDVIKSDNFCYRKVRIAITKWGAIEKKITFKRIQKIISHFGGTNKIFADCILLLSVLNYRPS